MKRRLNPARPAEARAGERGAALITTLLLCTLLLLAGGALIVKTSGAVSTAYDATSEMQAYYAAEAGIHSALNVLRGNHQNGDGDKATFRNAVDMSGGTLGDWLVYNGAGRVMVGDHAFSILVEDAGVPAAVAPAAPSRLRITSTGFGPRGARKQLQMVVRNITEIELPGGVTLIGKTAGSTTMTFDLGTSAKRSFLSEDASKPVFVTTIPGDTTTVTTLTNEDKKHVTYTDPTVSEAPAGSTAFPDFLSSPATAEALVEDLEAAATGDNGIKIVNGDYTPPKDSSGIVVVRGKLSFGGNTNFTGIMLVLGDGEVEWKGDGTIRGAIFVAKYNADKTGFDAPILNLSGAGTSEIIFSPTAAQEALEKLSFRIMGVQEQ
jgi:hypothetical protein